MSFLIRWWVSFLVTLQRLWILTSFILEKDLWFPCSFMVPNQLHQILQVVSATAMRQDAFNFLSFKAIQVSHRWRRVHRSTFQAIMMVVLECRGIEDRVAFHRKGKIQTKGVRRDCLNYLKQSMPLLSKFIQWSVPCLRRNSQFSMNKNRIADL